MIVLRDISELIKIEYAKTIEKVSDMMIASTSHDMRTPLNTIINMHTLLEKYVTEPRLAKYLQVSKISANILISLVDDTLDYY